MSREGNAPTRETMNDLERAELAAKLESELEEWIDSLPRTPYKDGWPEDRWQVNFSHWNLVFFLIEPRRKLKIKFPP